MGGFDADRHKATSAVPEPVVPMAMIGVGHPAAPAALTERAMETAARSRRPLCEIVFGGE
jgi:hypothetical protein